MIMFLNIPLVSGVVPGKDQSFWTPDRLTCLEKLVYFNECSSRPEKLISWREDEDFPSLGIGHFIWYPAEKKGPFSESFPGLLLFLKENGIKIPDEFEKGPPWPNREEFEKDSSSERMLDLRNFLEQTRGLQIQFIVNRMDQVLPKMLDATIKEKHEHIKNNFDLVAQAPNGMIAMIDYVNFKGEGTSLTERLKGQGWGLLQVLEEMKTPEKPEDALSEFVRAAQEVLEKRVKGFSGQKDERRALKGWKKRVQNYLEISC